MPAWLNRAVNRNTQERDVLFKIGVDLLQGDIGAVLVWKYDLFLYLEKLHVCCMACGVLIFKAVHILSCTALLRRLKSIMVAFLRVKKGILFNTLLFNFQCSLLPLYFKKEYIYVCDGMSHLLLPLISHGFSLALLEHENYSMSSFLGHGFCFPCSPPLNLNWCHSGFAGLGRLCQF